MLIIGAFIGYFGVRALTQGSVTTATANAHSLIHAERWLGIDVESRVQQAIVDDRIAVTLGNWIYIWGHWPVIIAVGVWLYLRVPDEYRLIRDAFFISGGIGMLFFVLFPVTPPRLTDTGLTDTVATYSHAYRALQPPSLVNRYAAFPSLHFGWDLLIGIALVRCASSWWIRGFGVLMPLAMATAVVVTANHWVIDVVAGGTVALIGLAGAVLMRHPAGDERTLIVGR
jgi:hypothetical protein